MTATRACAFCQGPLPPRRRRFCTDEHRRRGQKAERVTETADVGQHVVRLIRSLARRVGASDIDELGALWSVQAEAEKAVADAIDDLRTAGFSWADLGGQMGMTRQAAQQWRARRSPIPAPGHDLSVNGPLTSERAAS